MFERERISIVGFFIFLTLVMGVICINYPIVAEDIKYNIRGNSNLPVIIPGQAFIGKPDFTLEDMKYLLIHTPCSDCPKVDTFNKLVLAYKASNRRQKPNILETLKYFSSMADNGFCPGIPSTGKLQMVLK